MDGLGEVIWRERRKRGWSQRELGRRAGVNLQYLSRIEAGEGNPTLALVEAILGALGLRMTFVQEGQDDHRAESGSGGSVGDGRADVPGVELDR